MDRSDDRNWTPDRGRALAQRRRADHRAHQRSDAAVIAALALALTACGGGGQQQQYGVPEDPIPEAEPPKPKPKPKSGFVWALALPASKGSGVTGVAADASGHVYVAGAFDGVITLGATQLQSAGTSDAFVAQLSAEDGTVGWAKQLGDKGRDDRALVAIDPTGDVVVSATLSDKPRIVKYAGADGAEQWSVQLASKSALPDARLAVDGNGDVLIGGTHTADVEINDTKLTRTGKSNAFFAKLSGKDGSTVWAHSFGPDAFTRGIAADAAGNAYAIGWFSKGFAFGDARLAPAKRETRLFLASFAVDGTPRWAKQLEAHALDANAWDLAVDGGGNTALVGVFGKETQLQGSALATRGSNDGYVASYGAEGVPRWFHQHGAETQDDLHTVDFTLADQAIVTGTLGNAVHVASYSPTGALEWSHRADATDVVFPKAASVDAFGFVYVAGHFAAKVSFGDTTIETEGEPTAFIAKLRP